MVGPTPQDHPWYQLGWPSIWIPPWPAKEKSCTYTTSSSLLGTKGGFLIDHFSRTRQWGPDETETKPTQELVPSSLSIAPTGNPRAKMHDTTCSHGLLHHRSKAKDQQPVTSTREAQTMAASSLPWSVPADSSSWWLKWLCLAKFVVHCWVWGSQNHTPDWRCFESWDPQLLYYLNALNKDETWCGIQAIF